jgi:hypothetical protein
MLRPQAGGEEQAMRRRAIIGALLLATVGVVLGATVFRTGIAQATGRSKSVTQAGVTGGSNAFALACPNTNNLGFKVTASGLAIHTSAGVAFFALKIRSLDPANPGVGLHGRPVRSGR